jgi:hypothetical protein
MLRDQDYQVIPQSIFHFLANQASKLKLVLSIQKEILKILIVHK